MMAERHLSGQNPWVELAAVGRRVCEQEHDLLLALGLPAEPSGTDGAGAPGSDLHGRPTAAELVNAVAMFLREDIMAATDGRLNFLARVAAAIRDGTIDADDPALLAAVRAAVTDRLAVANPRYLTHPALP